jgi:hypothetical protein
VEITVDHPSSKYGKPVILDNGGNLMDHPDGAKAVRYHLGLSVNELGEVCGISGRTVESWSRGGETSPLQL